MGTNGTATYPRRLTERERNWIEWILPAERPGYAEYRSLAQTMVVIGPGRRGEGEFLLGKEGTIPDVTAPLPPVFAYGSIETDAGTISITLREVFDGQISVEIVSHRGETVPQSYTEQRRWTYSMWRPGDACPQCGRQLRTVPMHSTGMGHDHLVLALCAADKRMWVYDSRTQVNRLIPVTNFYNELMLHKNIRDAKIALDHKRLFTEIHSYSDEELAYAFLTYNKLKAKVRVEGAIEADRPEPPGIIGRLRSVFSGRHHAG